MVKRQRAASLPAAHSHDPPRSEHPDFVSRRDWLLLGIILGVAIALRLAQWSSTTIEHFDEGVYASNLWFGSEDGFQYPQRHLYAPPLTPFLIEWTMVLSGQVSGHTAIWPSLAAGVATVGVVWWLGRNIFSVRAGHLAAIFAALSGTHILLSRAALTDALLLLWFVLAIGLLERAFRTLRWSNFIFAGLAVGLAWWTKYNGWLPLFVGLLSLCVGLVLDPTSRQQSKRRFAGWCLALLVAFAIWSPYLLSLQSRGGYAAVNANHRQYIVGPSGWLTSLTRQLANLGYIGGWGNTDLLCLGLGAAGVGMIAVGQFRRGQVGTGWSWRLRETPPRIAATWYLALGGMTPLYTPYPRLLLPWIAASWIASGILVDVVIRGLTAQQNKPETHSRQSSGIVLAACVLVGGLVTCVSGRAWSDRRGLEDVARRSSVKVAELRPDSSPELPSIVYVYGEPALLFQLRCAGVAHVMPIQSLQLVPGTADGVPVPTYLAIGPNALRDRDVQSAWPTVKDRYELIGTFVSRPSTLVILDNYDPRELQRALPAEEVRLYRIRSRHAPP